MGEKTLFTDFIFWFKTLHINSYKSGFGVKEDMMANMFETAQTKKLPVSVR